jgi:lysophospholipase L1-like esterase
MNLIKNSFIILFFSLLTLKLSDIAFGSFQDQLLTNTSLSKGTSRAIHLREFNPNQQAVVRPTNYYMQGVENLEQINYAVNIDSNGFIKTGNPELDNPEIKILFLGGSTTETLFVPEDQRFPSIVERTLREKLGKDIEVYNSGVSGNNSMHSLFIFLSKGIPLKPTHAVLMHNINDFGLLFKSESYWVAPISRSLLIDSRLLGYTTIEDSTRTAIFNFFKAMKNSLVPNLYIYLRPRLFANVQMHQDEFTAFRKKDFEDLNLEEYKNQFQSSLVSFIELSRAWNIEPILMTQANRIDPSQSYFQKWFEENSQGELNINQFAGLYKLFNQIIRDIALEKKVILIDLDILVPKTDEFIIDTIHFNKAGSILVAESINAALIKTIK